MSGPGQADVVVVAAGASRRMDGVDKLLAPIAGRPLIAWTLGAFATSPVVAQIVVVASPTNIDAIAGATWLPDGIRQVVVGADRRQGSVAAGVEALRTGDRPAGVVLVHDGARPLVSEALIASVTHAAEIHGAAIPGLPIAETVKRVDGDVIGETVDRSVLVTAQTPQGVRTDLLLGAYDRFPPGGPQTFTDEASLLEACSIPVHVVPGDPGNLKVTLPADLQRVAAALGGTGRIRTGIGHDSHPFGPGTSLRLGGVAIDAAPRLVGHSDGDVVLHAVCDALLGATGLGDLGRLFPADARTRVGIDSRELLAEVRRRVEAAGWRATAVDVTVIAARPRLAAHLDPMCESLAGLLGSDRSAVSVKASTGNLDGPEGAGRSISALAIATVEAIR